MQKNHATERPFQSPPMIGTLRLSACPQAKANWHGGNINKTDGMTWVDANQQTNRLRSQNKNLNTKSSDKTTRQRPGGRHLKERQSQSSTLKVSYATNPRKTKHFQYGTWCGKSQDNRETKIDLQTLSTNQTNELTPSLSKLSRTAHQKMKLINA